MPIQDTGNGFPSYYFDLDFHLILEKFRNTVPWPEVVAPREHARDKGAIAAMLGLAPCPWCDCRMDDTFTRNYPMIAVCTLNPKHIVEWLPWPG